MHVQNNPDPTPMFTSASGLEVDGPNTTSFSLTAAYREVKAIIFQLRTAGLSDWGKWARLQVLEGVPETA